VRVSPETTAETSGGGGTLEADRYPAGGHDVEAGPPDVQASGDGLADARALGELWELAGVEPQAPRIRRISRTGTNRVSRTRKPKTLETGSITPCSTLTGTGSYAPLGWAPSS
jgi:hypothetical protein